MTRDSFTAISVAAVGSMTTIHNARQRTSPSYLKKTVAKSHRPSTLLRTPSSPKLKDKSGKRKVAEEEVLEVEEDDDMATSFLQFWYVMISPTIRSYLEVLMDLRAAPCVRSRLSCPTTPSSIALRGI